MTRRGGVALLMILCLVPAASADADVACERVAGGLTLKVTMDAADDDDYATLKLDGVEIAVLEGLVPTPISCEGGGGLPPTTNNTDLIRIRELSSGRGTVRIRDLAAFAPGATDAGDDAGPATANEIEFDLTSKGKVQDILALHGSPEDDYLRLGRERMNPNAGEELPPDSDLSWTGFEYLEVVPGDDNDIVTGAGSAGTGKPLQVGLNVIEGDGIDTLVGGMGRDGLHGGLGNDTLKGKRGGDFLEGGGGADLVSGGPGSDQHRYAISSGQDIFVDIGTGGANDGSVEDGPALARDEIKASVETIFSLTSGLSTLIGDEDANGLDISDPGGGPAVLRGRGGADSLDGGPAGDTLSGGSGRDRFVARNGPDLVNAQDGVRDREINCGGGDDVAEIDGKDPKPKSC